MISADPTRGAFIDLVAGLEVADKIYFMIREACLIDYSKPIAIGVCWASLGLTGVGLIFYGHSTTEASNSTSLINRSFSSR